MTGELNVLAGQLTTWLWSISWHIAVLVGLVGAVSLLCRRSPANFRYGLWCIVLLRLCLPVNLATPWGMGDRVQHVFELSAPSLLSASSATPRAAAPTTRRAPIVASAPIVHGEMPRGSVQPSPPPGIMAEIEAVPLNVKLAAIWASVALIVSLLVAFRCLQARRLLKSCPPVENPKLAALVDELRLRLGIGRRVALLCFPPAYDTRGPAVTGVWRPVIVLPPQMAARWNHEELAPVLLHELAHVKRRDLPVNFLQILVQIVFFFHPLVWYANSRIRRERELACDDLAVLHSGGRPHRYSRSIVRVLEEIGKDEPALASVSLGMTEQRHSIGGRITRMMSNNYRAHRPMGALSGMRLILIALAGITLAGGFAAGSPEPIPSDKAEMMGRVEDFFLHNFRDITARKSLEWGDVETDDARNRSIRYKYRATIWDKEVQIMNQTFTFDPKGAYVSVKDVEGFPKPEQPKVLELSTKAELQTLVEEFFTKNYRDITARQTIEWGEPEKHENGNISIRYKFEATIWDKDKKVMDQVFTFDAKGEYVSAVDAVTLPAASGVGGPATATDTVDLSSPAACVTGFTRAASAGDLARVLAHCLPDGEDYEDIRSVFTREGHSFRPLFAALDADKPVVVVTQNTTTDNRLSITWRVTFGRAFEIEGKKFEPGSTFDLDATLKKSGQRWMIDNL